MGKVVSKVLKVVAVGASIAAAAVTLGASLGLSAALFSAISLGASVGSSLLARKVRAPETSDTNLDRLRANVDPRTPRKTVIGITAAATDIRDEEFTDNQTYFHRFIVCASHRVQSIDEIWFDDEMAWSATGGVTSKFSGYLTVAVRAEGTAANAINISSRMGSSRRYTGLAYVHLRYKLTGNTSKTDSPFAQGITTRITIRAHGAPLYDPREDSTVPGGSGSQRADDQNTWAWDDDACRNPALALLFYLLGWRINGKLAVGKGIPPSRIDLESFAIAANICDEPVDDGSGGTEPRYRCDGVWSEGDSPTAVIDMLKATMNADLDDVGGRLRLTVFHNDLATPDAEFTDDDILGAYAWEPTPPLDRTYNVVRGTYTDPSDSSLYQQVDYPEIRADSPDGIDRILTLDLPFVESASQAQRLAELRRARLEHGAGTFRAVFQPTAWAVQKNSIIRLTFGPTGFVQKTFRVSEMDIQTNGLVPLTLREESPLIYGAPSLREPIEAVPSTPYDPALNPLVQQIGATVQLAIATSYVTDADPPDGLIQAEAPGGVVSMTIENHTRTYSDIGSVAVDGDTLTTDENSDPLATETTYHIAYDDPARAGGAVTYVAYLNAQDAATSGDNPARHYVGSLTTPAADGSSSGGGASPPGWDPDQYCVADDTPILLADGRELPARAIKPGMMIRTRHERTLAWGRYRVSAISFADEPVLACAIETGNGVVTIRATADHRFHVGGEWVRAADLGRPAGMARVARITVQGAHTYVSAGVLSHNIKAGGL